ncbi:helix-turn-helix domain-containing protein [Paenibacillus mendelii]|uniref:Helix-turn-helix domain-containing protein n=1 Tax=Paenibacillus mendelii TaxID=206163 RepID=A0ABV6JEB3_9BACL|nr:AraC family transcriptional regulator [Paenibacillus mendelii]MCQ6557122.1 AraC family transcriptional regulator [Paenibacillus mendelii]
MLEIDAVFFDDRIEHWQISSLMTTKPILALITNGNLIYELDSTVVPLTKGDVLLILPGTVRTGYHESSAPHQKYAAIFHLILPPEHPFFHFTKGAGYRLFRPKGFEYLRQRFSALYRMWLSQSAFRDMTSVGILMEIVGMLMQELEQHDIPTHKAALSKTIEHYIVRHFKEEIRLQDLAQLVERTPNYVSTIFKETSGQTPIEFMHHIRITTARHLLLQTNMTITEVSDALGYCDPPYFNRMFKKIAGHAPSELIKQRKEQ